MSDKMGLFILKGDKMSKGSSRLMKLLDIAAVVVRRGDSVLTVWNDSWGAFTLPMSKRRLLKDPEAREGSERLEDWKEAAVRAAAEALGRTIVKEPELILDMSEFQQSDRDGTWKRYHIQAFELLVDDDTNPSPARVTEWLTPEQIADERREPISPTARHIIGELRLKAIL
jgi:hypothetical protein